MDRTFQNSNWTTDLVIGADIFLLYCYNDDCLNLKLQHVSMSRRIWLSCPISYFFSATPMIASILRFSALDRVDEFSSTTCSPCAESDTFNSAFIRSSSRSGVAVAIRDQ